MFNTATRFGTSRPKINSIPTPSCSNVAGCGIRAAGGEIEIDGEGQRRLRHGRQRQKADAARLHQPAQGCRRAGDQSPAPAGEAHLVIGHERRAAEHQLQHEPRLPRPRPSEDKQPAAGQHHGRSMQQD